MLQSLKKFPSEKMEITLTSQPSSTGPSNASSPLLWLPHHTYGKLHLTDHITYFLPFFVFRLKEMLKLRQFKPLLTEGSEMSFMRHLQPKLTEKQKTAI